MSTTFLNGWRAAGTRERLSADLTRWVAYLELVLQVRRERQALRRLSPHQIADLGLDPGAVVHESGRGMLDVPRSRLGDLG